MTTRQTTVRFTGEQHEWLRRRAFDLNQPQQSIIEDALVAQGMPRGDSPRVGDVLTAGIPKEVKDVTDAEGCLWIRTGASPGWVRVAPPGVAPATGSASKILRVYGPVKVAKLRVTQ